MAITYGFYNSKDGDRKYDSVQMSAIFDGIILDGVYVTIGDAFAVKAGGGLNVIIGTGRAWFNRTWTLNDIKYPITMSPPPVLNSRYDMVVIEVNLSPTVRANSVKVVQGVVATNPVWPKPLKSDLVNQFPIAYILRKANETVIPQSQITNAVGTSETPFVTGVLKHIDVDMLIAKWEAEWYETFGKTNQDIEAAKKDWEEQWNTWFTSTTAKEEMEFKLWMEATKAAYDTWFAQISGKLDTDVAASLARSMAELETAMNEFKGESAAAFAEVEKRFQMVESQLVDLIQVAVVSDKSRKMWVQQVAPTTAQGAKDGDIWIKTLGKV